MRIERFSIERFRSIKSTGWLPFSEDGITVLVGQNESGKSSILDALNLGFSTSPEMRDDDFRMGEDLPEVHLSFSIDERDIQSILEDFSESIQGSLLPILRAHKERIELSASIVKEQNYRRIFALGVDLIEAISELSVIKGLQPTSEGEAHPVETSPPINFSVDLLTESVWNLLPSFILFKDDLSQLPNKIDIVDGKLGSGAGLAGARNYLAASGLSLANLLSFHDRAAATALNRANEKVTDELQRFWSQLLGQTRKIRVECELRYRASAAGDKAGTPYLVFWISEGGEKLYPSQRSKGTRWFISFFLQLLARQANGGHSVILLDEPGALLHATAQLDVVRLIEHLSKDMPVVYSTHSPYLLDQKKLHRILAVERRDEGDESPTSIRRGLEIATASPLTLAPILTLIGVDLSQQDVIKKDRNVILEEVSAYYYLLAFKKLLNIDFDLSFVASGGADNVRLLVDLFIAWGLKFTVLVDDDPHGKKICREIKSKYHIEDKVAARKLLRLEGCEGVEDMFDVECFRQCVANLEIHDGSKISATMKNGKHSKPVFAVGFYNKVTAGDIGVDNISEQAKGNFTKIFELLKHSFD